MKTLFLDLGMGAAGDMLTAALYELIDDKKDFIKEINAAGIPGVEIKAEAAVRCGICGTHMNVLIDGQKEGSSDAGCEHFHEEHEHMHEHCHSESSHPHEDRHCHGPKEHSNEEEHEPCRSHVHDEGAHSHEHFSDGHHHHSHRSLADIGALIDALKISDKVKADVKAVYNIIADAESKAHGVEVSEIHFHEVGTMDALADITAACCLMERLAPDKIIASPVCTGYGHVHASHGIIPVPAPATAYILEDIPSYEGDIGAELCTPTGAALVRYFADEFGRMPVMYKKKTGYGMGTKDLEKCNALRAVTGQIYISDKEEISSCAKTYEALSRSCPGAKADPEEQKSEGGSDPGFGKNKGEGLKDTVTELSFTVDDMTGEETAFACERIFAAGALDVYTRPVYMKKNRPGVLIDVLASEDKKDAVVEAIFKHTTTLGIRQALCERYILKRETETIETPFGPVRKKISSGYGAEREKFEYDDICRAALKAGMSLREVKEEISGA